MLRQAPIAISPKPTVEALVRACMRDSASGKRTTPIAESSVSTAPHEHDRLADHSPCPSMKRATTAVPMKPTSVNMHRHLQERAAPGVLGLHDDHAEADHQHAVDGDHAIGQASARAASR